MIQIFRKIIPNNCKNNPIEQQNNVANQPDAVRHLGIAFFTVKLVASYSRPFIQNPVLKAPYSGPHNTKV